MPKERGVGFVSAEAMWTRIGQTFWLTDDRVLETATLYSRRPPRAVSICRRPEQSCIMYRTSRVTYCAMHRPAPRKRSYMLMTGKYCRNCCGLDAALLRYRRLVMGLSYDGLA